MGGSCWVNWVSGSCWVNWVSGLVDLFLPQERCDMGGYRTRACGPASDITANCPKPDPIIAEDGSREFEVFGRMEAYCMAMTYVLLIIILLCPIIKRHYDHIT